MLLRIFRISGHSMMPTLNPGDKILTSSVPYWFFSPKVSDIVMFKYKNKNFIKRIKKISNNQVWLEGDNKIDSFKVGWVKRQDIIGKVLHVITL